MQNDKAGSRTTERGSFTVRQAGMILASGSGPYDAVVREANHYALVYGQDGPVKVSIRKIRGTARAGFPVVGKYIDRERTIPALTLSQCIEWALHELQEALQSRQPTDYVESRIRRAIMLLRGEAVP